MEVEGREGGVGRVGEKVWVAVFFFSLSAEGVFLSALN